jgi:hypothetical protein
LQLASDIDARDFSRREQACQALPPQRAAATVDNSRGSL